MLTSYSLRIVNGKLYGAKNRAPACLGLNFQTNKKYRIISMLDYLHLRNLIYDDFLISNN